MSNNAFLTDLITDTVLSRRCFMKWSAALGGTAALAASGIPAFAQGSEELAQNFGSTGQMFRTCCPAHNCGGRCPLVVTVQDGMITRIGSDDREYDEIDRPRVVACSRGKAYRRRQYHPDRLKYPMKRVGPRGSGQYERISWDEAIETVATQMQRIKEQYGNSAIFVPYGTGGGSQMMGAGTASRLMNLFGGRLNYYNNYSWAAIQRATPTVYGTQNTGNQRQDWLNSRYIIMWGWNPAEMMDGTNSAWFIRKARENGAKVIAIDPRRSLSVNALADEWIPIRPGTDTAMMSAMAYVMVTEELYDAEFVEKYTIGFDRSQMPEGYEDEESYKDYLLGTVDGIPKTPEWAESITGVPREKIIEIARDYATIKPGMLYQGYGMQRRAYGEQVVRAGCVLPALTGNVGIPGGWAGGMAFQAGGAGGPGFPGGTNPITASIPSYMFTDAVLRGTEMGPEDGVVGVEKLDNSIRMIYAVASNCMINQHGNSNRSAQILADETLCEFIVVHEQFLTSTAKFADILLPACTQFETYGLNGSWKYGEEALYGPKLVEPMFESKSDFQICAEVAERLGLGEAYTEGRDERGWIEYIMEQRKTNLPDFPSLQEFEDQNLGFYQRTVTEPIIAFKAFREDPVANPLETPSGKIEIFSPALFEMNNPEEIPAIPKYIQEWESPFGPEAAEYPLQAVNHHYMHRVHSTHHNVDWLDQAFPQRVFINPIDAQARGLQDGDVVKVWNDRGTIMTPVRLTRSIMPGVVDIPQGAWYLPDENGVDQGGCANTLTSERPTPLAFGNTQQTIMVQVAKA